LYQLSMITVDPNVVGLEPDSFERNLPDFLTQAVPPEELRELAGSSEGAPIRCALSKLGMMLLQFRYDLSERELLRRCQRDLGFRYALGLEAGQKPPSGRTYRRFRDHVTTVMGEDYLLRLSLRAAVSEGLLEDVELQAVDSTNTDCRGAIIDTFNLVAAGIGQVLRQVSLCLGVRAEEMARRWDLSRYLARGIKGAAGIDWSDEQQRNALLTQEIRDADRVAERVRELQQQMGLPRQVEEAVELLAQVARQDVEELEDGTFRIAKGTASGRIISITDPEARHGRKSAAKTIKGFKTHVAGTIESQFVTGIAITDAATHDAQPTQALIAQTEANRVKPAEMVGDNAYGAGANIRASHEVGVEMHTKASCPSRRGALPKQDFDIDLGQMKVTCPAGQSTQTYSLVKYDKGEERVPKFHFAQDDCQACELKGICCEATAKGGHRSIRLNPFEPELQQNRAFAQTPRGREVLRSRSAVERLISHLVRMGMRHARFFTLKRVQFQAFMVGAAYNLQRLFTLRATAATAR